jgi:hypothetical protein
LPATSVFGAFPLPGHDVWRRMAPAADPGTEADLVTDQAVLADVARLLGERTGCDPSQLKVTYRDGPLGRRARKWFSGKAPLPGDRVPDIECVRAEGDGHTTLHAELGDKSALVLPGRMVSDECATVVAKRLGEDRMITLVTDSDGEIMLVRPDAHLGRRGRADPDALDHRLNHGLMLPGR